MHENDPAAVRFEAEIDLPQFAEGLRDGAVPFTRGIKHQEPARARPQKLSAHGARLPARVYQSLMILVLIPGVRPF